jgi:hypothetical protein
MGGYWRTGRWSVGLLLTLSLGAAVQAGITAGAAKKSIVPPFATPMAGFFDRTAVFQGVHDEIYARALALSNEQTSLIIIATDLAGVNLELTRRVREAVQATTGVGGDHILLCATHNHSGPGGFLRGDDPDRERIIGFLAGRMSEAAIEAWRGRIPARVGHAMGEIFGATRNRQQDNDEIIDPQVGVVRVERADGSRAMIATLINFTGHPVIVGSENLKISAEWPGVASAVLETVMGGVALFTQGACGDVTMHRGGDPFLEIERVGRLVAGEALKTLETIRCWDEISFDAAETIVEVEPRVAPSLAEAERALREASANREQWVNEAPRSEVRRREIERKITLFESDVRLARRIAEGEEAHPSPIPAIVQAFQIGDLYVAAIPGELFVEYALELRRRIKQATARDMILVGYANDYLGYVVTPRAVATGGYEAAVARLAPSAGRAMVEAVFTLSISLE